MSEPLDFPEMMWAVMRPESTGLVKVLYLMVGLSSGAAGMIASHDVHHHVRPIIPVG